MDVASDGEHPTLERVEERIPGRNRNAEEERQEKNPSKGDGGREEKRSANAQSRVDRAARAGAGVACERTSASRADETDETNREAYLPKYS